MMTRLLLVFVLLTAWDTSNAALFQYVYEGENFNSYGSNFPSTNPPVTNLEFGFVTDGLLGADERYSLRSSETQSYYVTDGYFTVTDQTPGWDEVLGWIETDASGDIYNWSFYIERGGSFVTDEPRLFDSTKLNDPHLNFEDFVVYCYQTGGTPPISSCTGSKVRSTANFGSWSVNPVPIPAGIWFFCSGLSILGWLGWRTQ